MKPIRWARNVRRGEGRGVMGDSYCEKIKFPALIRKIYTIPHEMPPSCKCQKNLIWSFDI